MGPFSYPGNEQTFMTATILQGSMQSFMSAKERENIHSIVMPPGCQLGNAKTNLRSQGNFPGDFFSNSQWLSVLIS